MRTKILWVDDEIHLLKAHIMFLNDKGFEVKTVTNGEDAIISVEGEEFDIVFLDEQMPGMNGLDTLAAIKSKTPQTPVVMITKSEEEHVMEDAIGSKIADYLIKPVNPNQILLSCKKILDGKTLVSQKINSGYQQDFRNIGMAFFENPTAEEWVELYKKLVDWEIKMEESNDSSMKEVLFSQKAEANVNFSKFIASKYTGWLKGPREKRPLLSPDLLKEKVFPLIKQGQQSVFFILVDCLRFDQWKAFEPIISQYFTVDKEECYYGIIPTATQYARNAIFSGMFPSEIASRFPNFWKNDDDEGGKNLHEPDFLTENIVRNKLNIKHHYTKIISNDDAKQYNDAVMNHLHNDLNVVVINFIDMLTHARSEMNIVKELAPDEAAFRSISKSWLEHSAFLVLLKKLQEHKVKIVITTDHGSVKVHRPIKIIGDKNTTTNLRYKQGRNLNYDDSSRQIFAVKNPEDVKLPKSTVSGTYAFATDDGFFVYPNNYNYYVNYFKDTFQHGGISLEEMIVPLITLSPK